MSIFNKSIVMIDFETTGLSPDMGDRITEVAALRMSGGKIVERYVSLVNCHVSVPYFITELTGITQAMVNSAPSCKKVIPELLRFIGSDTLAAHNASFDTRFLLAESQRLGLTPVYENLVCSLKLSRRVFPGLASYKLGTLSSALGIRFNSAAHRAEADAEVAAQVLHHIGNHLGKTYRLSSIDPQLLEDANKLSAAKVAAFLTRQAQSQGQALEEA